MSRNVFDPSALVSSLPNLLPQTKKTLQSPQDALAVLFHTAMSVLAFRLIGLDETTSSQTYSDNVLPESWSSHGPGSYTFRYRHEQSSLEFILKVSKLGTRTLVHAIALESDKAASLDIATNDFVSPSFFPHDLSKTDAQPLIHGYISSNRVADLISQFQLTIVQKLIPGLRKEGYTESPADSSSDRGPAPAPQPDPSPSRPQPVQPPISPPISAFPPRNPLEIGRRDLDPFPRNPFAPPSLFPDNSGDGMYVGPNHPIFGPGMRGPGGGGRGPWGGDGFLPPMGAPPGARFDPVGPGLGPHPGGPSHPFRLPGGGNMNDPDNDEFMPPGAGDMYM